MLKTAAGSADLGNRYPMETRPRSSRLPRLARAAVLAAGLVLVLGACQWTERQSTVRDMINHSRLNHDRRALPMHDAAAAKAQNWAEHLAACRCIEHSYLPSGLPGGWRAIGENVGRTGPGGTLLEMHQAFMQSSGHRANILDTRWTDVGTGVASRGSEKFVVHVFVQY
jgi:uncharacterized protein YkwD